MLCLLYSYVRRWCYNKIRMEKTRERVVWSEENPNALYAEIRFDTMEDGECIQILHIGPYDDESTSFEKMAQFAKDSGLERRESRHREICLNNAGRAETNKLKTILRYSVR